MLSKHLKKCNVAKRTMPECYMPGINKGVGATPDHTPSPSLPLSSCPAQLLDEVIKKVESAYAGHVTSIEEEFLTHPSFSADLCDPANGASALKHITQQASIVDHLEKRGLLDVPRVSCYVEYGAGRGKLTAAIHQAIQFSSVSIIIL